jgi:pimeloyl-ACP methyl ester carboxylesterase
MASDKLEEDRAARSILWTSADGLQLHALAYDPPTETIKAPVVCIPGLTRNARDFDDLGPWLAQQGRLVIGIDLRGRGRSQNGPATKYRPATYVDDVRRLLRDQGIERAHFIGTSLGGIVAMTLALGERSVIAGAVLNDVGPELGASGIKRIAAYAGKRTGSLKSWSEATVAVRQAYQTTFPRLGDEDWRTIAERSFKLNEANELILDYDPAIVLGGTRKPSRLVELVMWRGFKLLAACGPILAIRGGLSDLFEPATLARMKGAHPALMSAQIPEVGHAPTLDEPESRRALAAFFSLVD